MTALKAQGIPLISFHTPPAHGLLPGPRAEGCSATTSRRGATPWWRSNKTGKPIVGVEAGRDSLGIFAMTPIMRDGKSLARRRYRRLLRQAIRRQRQAALRRRPRRASFRRQGVREDRPRPSATSSVATQDELKSVFDGARAAPRRHAQRPSGRALSRADQELRRPAGRGDRSHQGHHRIRGGGGQFAAQPDSRHASPFSPPPRCWRSCSAAACRVR